MQAEEHRGWVMIDDYLARRVTEHLGGKWHGTYGRAPGPGHSRQDDSLQISPHESDPDDVVLHSFCGDDWQLIKDDLRARGVLPEKKRRPKGLANRRSSNGANGEDEGVTKRLVCAYDYVDEDGKLVFQVCRYLKSNGDKTFLQRRPDPAAVSGWDWKVKGSRVVPYRLPDVLAAIAAKRIVFIVEGEKDADNLAKLGLTATCNVGGASKQGKPKWTAKHAAFFHGADVVILRDNDEAGLAHRDAVAKSLQGIAARIRAVELPGVPEKGDVSDWLAKIGGDAPRLMALTESAPDWQLTAAKAPGGQSKAERLEAVIDELMTLSPAERELKRKAICKEFGVRVAFLDEQIQARRPAAEDRFAGAAASLYVIKPDFPPDNIGDIADMQLEVTAKGQIVSRSYVNAAISIAQNLGIRGKHDIFKDRHWIVFKGELVELTDPLIRTIQAAVAKDLGTDGGPGNVFAVLNYLSELNPFHPVRDYLNSLQWDGVDRSDWLAKTFGCTEPEEYLAAVSKMFLISMVARIMQPGCQADYKLIIEGEQGLMKSTALRILAVRNEWFDDNLPKLTGGAVRISMHMRGLWLIEISEMHATGKADNDLVKAFITRRFERYVAKYGKTVKNEPRQCIFAGTTNREAYFTDETGARRFWPVYAHKVDLGWLKENLDQLWAQHVQAYADGAHWWPESKFEGESIRPQQADRKEEPALAQAVQKYLARHGWPLGEPGEFQFDIWKHFTTNVMNPRPTIDYSNKVKRDIEEALRFLGYKNQSKRYPDAKGERVMMRKWWPPVEKMSDEIKIGLNLMAPPPEPPKPKRRPAPNAPKPKQCDDEGCSDFDAMEDFQ
jgi:5S rRNA maturation endonuclease (ribonuclease M5)